MRPVLEWCAVCLQDDVKVLAVQVIQQAPLCKACVAAYGEEKDVLRDAREFIRNLDSDKPATDTDPEYFIPESPSSAIKHLCICGCGTPVSAGGTLLPGHAARTPEPTPPSTRREPEKPLTPAERETLLATPIQKRVERQAAPEEETAMAKYGAKMCACGCGETFTPTGPRSRYLDGHNPGVKKIVRRGQENLAPAVSLPPVKVEPRREMSIERSQTMKVTVREQPEEEERREIQIKRKVTILVPGAKPVTQVKVTPEIAQAVWGSLTLEQKALLMDIESMWNDWDDWLRCETVGKILLISPDDAAKPTK